MARFDEAEGARDFASAKRRTRARYRV